MSTPEDKIIALKDLIQQHLYSSGITEKIDKVLKEQGKDQAIQSLSRENVVDKVVAELKNVSLNVSAGHEASKTDVPPPGVLVSGKRFLLVSINQGRAFLDDLDNNDGATVQIHLLFLGKRATSAAVPASCEPCFEETFYFCLDQLQKQGNMLTCQSQLKITLVRTDHTGSRQMLGSCSMEWRRVLDRPEHGLLLNQEITGTKSDCGVSVGILNIRLKVLPRLENSITSQLLKSQLALEYDRTMERDRLFLMYSKQWWNEYLALRPAHEERLVKIFTQDERSTTHMVCLMLSPLCSHLIESPRQAARFVSLIPCTQRSLPGSSSNSAEQWMSLYSFIMAKTGALENHCLLLCSLLLGFGLDSYVCIGTKTRGHAHIWVMTSPDLKPSFWDASTGQRFGMEDTMPYRTLDCVFNNTSFFANCQPSNSISKTKFDLRDPVLWKGISEEAIQSMVDSADAYSMSIQLNPGVVDPYQTADNLEHQLRRLVREERENNDLSTTWNARLTHLLLPALSAYELERSSGVTVNNDDFQQAIRHAVPTGFTFKGYPAQFNHLNIRQIFRQCMRSEVCADLMQCHGDSVQLAVKIRVYTYPEDVVAVWVMFACQYRCIL